MDSPEQRRKRKRFLKSGKLRHSPPVRSLVYCFSFFLFFYFIFRRHTTSFHHAVQLSTHQFDSLRVLSNFHELTQLTHFKLDARVSFPDHVLLIISQSPNSILPTANRFECVYRRNNSVTDLPDDVTKGLRVLSVDEYADDRFLVRCPLPPSNFSASVTLRRRGVSVDIGEHKQLNSWENLAYEAVLDGNTLIIFVKGISHRQGKESDPTHFNCHFGLPDLEGAKPDGKYVLRSKAVTAAQEVVRCAVPTSIVMNPVKASGVRVTVSFRSPRGNHVLVPSVAKIPSSIFNPKVVKHELCVCTMLWNQAHSIREWIMYHSWLGVEKWFVYDNNSDDEIKTVIGNLVSEGYNVSRHVWPWIKTQEAGFSHCAIRARSECNWVSFMDVDEFYYFPHNPTSGFAGPGSLKALVSNFTASSSIGEIRTSCHSFGPSGLTSRPKHGVTVGYTCRLQSPERHKSIIRPDALDPNLMNVVHHFHLRSGYTFIDLAQSVAVINHYKYQVWEVFRAKFYRRVATYVADWTENQNEGSRDRAPGLGTEAIEPVDWRLRFCEVWDTGLRDFVSGNLGDVSSGVLPWDREM